MSEVSIKEYFEARLSAIQLYYDERITTLKDNFEAKLVAQQLIFNTQLDAARREAESSLKAQAVAIDKAETANRDKLESMNEFRAQMGDEAAKFVTRDQHQSLMEQLASKVETLRITADARFKPIDEALAEARGKASMNSMYVAVGIGVVSIVLTITGLIMRAYGC